jgi:hypothetical protein
VTVAVDGVHRIAAVGDLPPDGGGDGGALVRRVDDVVAALAPALSRADVDDRGPDIGALADAARRVADEAGGAAHQLDVSLDRQVLEEMHVVGEAAFPPFAHAAGDVFRAGVGVRPQHDRRQADLAHRLECRPDLQFALAVLGRDGMLRHDNERRREVESVADALREDIAAGTVRGGDDLGHEVDARTADAMHVLGPFAETDDALGGAAARREMDMREFRHGVADALVDRAGDLATHRVRHGDVHVGGGEGRRHRLETVADGQNDVRLDPLEDARQLEQAEAGRFRHRRRRLAFDQHVDTRDRREAVRLDEIDDGAIAVEDGRGADDDLQLELGMRGDRPHRRFRAAVVGAAADDDADFSHARSVSSRRWSADSARLSRRPTISR